MKLILKSKKELTVKDNSTSSKYIAEFKTVSEIEEARVLMTDENLSLIAFTTDDGNFLGEYTNYTLDHVTYKVEEDVYVAEFVLRQYSDMDVHLNNIEKELSVQGDAIAAMSESLYIETK